MKFFTRYALAVGFLLGLVGQTFADGRNYPRGGAGVPAGATIAPTNINATGQIYAPTAKFDVVDAGSLNVQNAMSCNGDENFPNDKGARWGSAGITGDATGVYVLNGGSTAGSIRPASPGGGSCGTAAARWGNIYGVVGDFSSSLHLYGAAIWDTRGNTTASLSGLCGGNTGDECNIDNTLGAAAATSSIAAFRFRHQNGALDPTDLLLDVQDNSVSKLSTTAAGALTSAGTMTSSGGGFVGQFVAVNTNNAPTNGMHLPASNVVEFTSNGVGRERIDSTGVYPTTASGLPLGKSGQAWSVAWADQVDAGNLNVENGVTLNRASGLTNAAALNVTATNQPANGLDLGSANQPRISVASTESMRFPATHGSAGQSLVTGAGTAQDSWVTVDDTFCVYNAGNLAGATAFGETTLTRAATVDTASKITQDVVGVGAGNFVVKVCTDGTTCAAGNTYLTYTESCTAVAGTRTAAVVGNSGAIAANAVLTVSVTTACATTDPGANVCIHYTRP